ncbi:MAG: DUF262 domain-containing protein [Deltaproteobacteria bacterium]|nr:DUF262 domain-containing protein [Deltaproteobacteria bacterium]
MSTTASFVSQPQVADIVQLLADVRLGHIQIPRFQRPFVWKDERRLDLLRSIYIGIPIGSLIVWRTSETQLACFRKIAGISIPAPPAGQVVSYLLDGHQRLTTLLSTFSPSPQPGANGSQEVTEEDERPDQIFFDLEKDEFIVGNSTKSDLCLPMNLFLDAVALRKRFRLLERGGEGVTPINPVRLDPLQERAEKLLYAMQSCRIPIVPLTTNSLDLATQTFYRVNSLGMPMTEFHMISALTWGIKVAGTSLDLRQTFEDEWAASTLPPGWEPVDEQQTLSVIKGMFGMELSRAPVQLLVDRIKKHPEVAREAVALLVRAMHEAARILTSPQSVPYQLHITLTAIALHGLPPDAAIDREFLRRWWGLTTIWGSFASAPSHRVTAALRHLKAGIRGNPEPWPELLFRTVDAPQLPNLEPRNARAKYFVDWYAKASSQVDLLNTHGTRALVSLDRKASIRPGNRFLWPSDRMKDLKDALANHDHATLAGHFVDEGCLDAWSAGDIDTFISRREALMNAAEAEWYRGLRPDDFIAGRP